MGINTSVGAAEARLLEFGGRNISNGWHQFTVEEGYSYVEGGHKTLTPTATVSQTAGKQ